MKRLLLPLLISSLLIPTSAEAFISSSALKQLLKGGTRGAIKNTSVDKNESKNNSSSTNFFRWGLTEEQKEICRYRASKKNTDFSAKQAYNYCKKNIKAELKEKERKKLEKLKSFKGNCNWEKRRYRLYAEEFIKSKAEYAEFSNTPYDPNLSVIEIDRLQYQSGLTSCRKTLRKYNETFGDKNK